MNEIKHLWELKWLARKRKSVIADSGMFSHRPFPAAFVINCSGSIIYRLFENGLRVYEPKKTEERKIDIHNTKFPRSGQIGG